MKKFQSEEKMKQAVERDFPVPENIQPKNMRLSDNKIVPAKKSSAGMLKRFTAVAAAAAILAVGAVAAFDMRDKAVKKAEEKKEQEYSYEISKNEPSAVMNLYYKNSYNKIYDDLMVQKEKMKTELAETDDLVYNSAMGDLEEAEPMPDASDTNKGEVGIGTTESEGSDDYYKTYLQTEGIDEADCIKTDGKFIYYTVSDIVYVVDPNHGDPYVSAKHKFDDYYDYYYSEPQLYLSDGKLVAVYPAGDNRETKAEVFEITDKGELESLTSYTQSGDYSDSRMKNGKLYLITTDYVNFYDMEKENPDTFIPTYELNGETCLVPAEDIYISQNCHGRCYTNVGSFDITKSKPDVTIKSTLGGEATVYCSYENLYLMREYYDRCYSTEITKIALNNGDLKLSCAAHVAGYVKDQFAADEYKGYFRIAVTRSDDNAVYVLDDTLTVVGMVDGMGFDETIKSVSFSGDTGYVVTFRQTDPLYTIDLSDPKNPVITDALKVSGFSTHLRSFGDDLLLGFGQEADENTGWTTGVKLSMFKANAEGENEEIAKAVIGDEFGYAFSDAVWNHKYLMILPEKNLIGFPVYEEKWAYFNEDSGEYGEFDGGYYYVVYKYENEKFEELSRVKLGYTYKIETRAVYIDDVIYVFSNDEVISIDMNSGDVMNTKNLND